MDLQTPPPTAPLARPTAVTVLGWVFIVFSVLSVFGSALAVVAVQLMSRLEPGGEFPPKAESFPPGFEMLSWMFEYFNELLILQLLLAIFSVYAAARFLKLSAWARTYFEALNWIGIVWTLIFGVIFGFAWVGLAGGMPVPEHPESAPPAGLFAAFGVFASICVILFNCGLPAVMIWLLRSRFVRPAFERSA